MTRRRVSLVNSLAMGVGSVALDILKKSTLVALDVAGIERQVAIEKICSILQSFLEVPRPSPSPQSSDQGRTQSAIGSINPSIVIVDEVESTTSHTFDLVADMNDLDIEMEDTTTEHDLETVAKKTVTFVEETIESLERVSSVGFVKMNQELLSLEAFGQINLKDCYQELEKQIKDVVERLNKVQSQLIIFQNLINKNKEYLS